MCYTINDEEIPKCDRCKEEQPVLSVITYKACGLPPDGREFTRRYDRHCEYGFHNIKYTKHRGLQMTCRDCVVARFREGRPIPEHSIDATARLPSEGRFSEYTSAGEETETPRSSRVDRSRTKSRRQPLPQMEYGDESQASSVSQMDGNSSLRRSSRQDRPLRQDFSDEDAEYGTDSTQRANVSARREPSSSSRSAISSALSRGGDLTSSHTGTSSSVASRSRTEDLTTSEPRPSRRHRRSFAEEDERIRRLREELRERFWVPPVGKQRPR